MDEAAAEKQEMQMPDDAPYADACGKYAAK